MRARSASTSTDNWPWSGFGKRGAYHPLAVAGVKIGDVIVQVDGEAQPPGGRRGRGRCRGATARRGLD